jgi:hypothetical protein
MHRSVELRFHTRFLLGSCCRCRGFGSQLDKLSAVNLSVLLDTIIASVQLKELGLRANDCANGAKTRPEEEPQWLLS